MATQSHHFPAGVTPTSLLAHPVRLRCIAPEFLDGLKDMLGAEWNTVYSVLKDDSCILPEALRKLSAPGVAPRFTQLVTMSTVMPGGTEQGGPLGMLAFLRQEWNPAPHFLLDDRLVDLLENTDIAEDIPMSMFKLPFKRLYLELGSKRTITTMIPNALTGLHVLEGAYIEQGHHVEGEFLYVVLTGSPLGKSGPEDDATLSVALPTANSNEPLVKVVENARRRAVSDAAPFGLNVSPLSWTADTVQALLLLVKALLYIEMPETRRQLNAERTQALKAAHGLKSSAKVAKALRRAGRLYDHILIEPQAEHRLTPQPVSEDGRSVRAHWRRGHYRMQAHGPQMSLRKLIFLQPTLVAAGADESVSPSHYKVR